LSRYNTDAFETMGLPFPLHSWIAKKEKHRYDLNRAEESIAPLTDE
jgi:hypothetical protein